MKLTLAKTNELCEELWQWCVDTDRHTSDWPQLKRKGGDKEQTTTTSCFYCMYAKQRTDELEARTGKFRITCNYCPYARKYGFKCTDHRCPWSYHTFPLFLKQIKLIRKGGMKTYLNGHRVYKE